MLVVLLLCVSPVVCQFFDCHDDPSSDPEDGPLDTVQFTWLGALQYIHVKNGTPHYFRVPRAVLVNRQFALSTAVDAAYIPEGYALGNIVFGDYERDEAECQVSTEDLAAGADCEPAVMLVPIADVLLHPEFKHFGVRDSIALLKLIINLRSGYMVPVCLPFKDFLIGKDGKQTTEKIFHIDFGSDVPRDFIEEEKEVTHIRLLPRELCFLYDSPNMNRSSIVKNRVACSTGCGFRSGSPSLVHEHTGHWSVVSIAQGGSGCGDPLRPRRPPAPARHTLLHPYVPWITAAITGKPVGAFVKDDPFGYITPRVSPHDLVNHGWVGHWWMGGPRCYERGDAAMIFFKFYHEVFQVLPSSKTYLNYYLEIKGANDMAIICVKVGMPFRLGKPKVWQLDTPEVRVLVPLITFQHLYKFEVQAFGYNTTEVDSSESESESDTSESQEEDARRGRGE
ncbi:CLIP domain-containing serine protease B9-like [Aricia agestis]|uniref:CLIP domain-containing serine protease B9-like n=1 Tax=Aricia agestis TaxID=91739 RepID=UPI001C2080D4|nr:CLIP domain-containing serine protease B9-like [Aricia agestis]